MIRVAKVGVHDHMENMTGSEEITRNLMSRAAATARHRTSTVKMAALLVSDSFVDMTRIPSPTASPAGFAFALALRATHQSLRRRERRRPGRITGFGYRVFERRPLASPGSGYR